jgi:hypothetical protein
MRHLSVIVAAAILIFSCAADGKEERIRTAVEKQLGAYPESTLQDIYKNFFQDYFGPGHMVDDTLSAGAYLNTELASIGKTDGTYYEPTGYNGNFYRVDLSVITDGFISRDAFFDAFIRSVSDLRTITLDEWVGEWKEIDSVIDKMDLQLVDYATERENIFSLLRQGKYAMHHSERFSAAYDPHYRIVGREIFEKEILPRLP